MVVQYLSGPSGPTVAQEAVEPLSAGQLTAYRRALSKSRVAAIREEAAKKLGEQLADDKASVRAISLALTDKAPGVRRAARKAIEEILAARTQGRNDEQDRLEEFGNDVHQKAYQLGQGTIDLIQWLWDNFYFWPAFDGLAALPGLTPKPRTA